jgi:hypothetical protein
MKFDPTARTRRDDEARTVIDFADRAGEPHGLTEAARDERHQGCCKLTERWGR